MRCDCPMTLISTCIIAAMCGLLWPAGVAAGEMNPYGGMIVPPIDWSSLPKPARTGDIKDELKHPVTKEFITRYRLFVPATLPEKRHLALLICFHGRTGNENGPSEMMYHTIKALGLDERDALFMSIDSGQISALAVVQRLDRELRGGEAGG